PYHAYHPTTTKDKDGRQEAKASSSQKNAEEDETPHGELPKGFFDDPVQDAK
ncbi:Zinc finger protein 830like, partial [Caligus rogercresseyi]